MRELSFGLTTLQSAMYHKRMFTSAAVRWIPLLSNADSCTALLIYKTCAMPGRLSKC